MGIIAQQKATAKLKAATKERDAFKVSMDKAAASNAKRLAKLEEAITKAQASVEKHSK